MEEEKEQKISLSSFSSMLKNSRRIFLFIWKEEKKLIVISIILYLIVSSFSYAQSGAMALLINALTESIGLQIFSGKLILFLFLVVIAGLISPIVYAFVRYIDKLLNFFLEEKFQHFVLEAQAHTEIAAHENVETKNLINRVMENGTWRIENFVGRQFWILQNIFEVIIAGVILALLNWWIFCIVFICLIPELINEITYGKNVWGIFHSKGEIRRKFYNTRNHFHSISDITELKLFQNIKYFLNIINELFRTFQNEQRIIERKRLLKELGVVGISQLSIAFAIVWFVWDVVKGDMQIGTLTFVIASINGLRGALSGFFMNMARQYEDNLFVTDVFKLIDLKPTVKIKDGAIKLDRKKVPEISFNNVTFIYPTANTPVLKNFSLTIKPGEKLAIVGINGAGKTTFVKLLCRFYDPQEGSITIDGVDIRDIDLDTWYEQVGVLFQEYARYLFAVKESIGVGRTSESLSLERVKHSAEASEAHTFIEQWEHQYEQQLCNEYTEGKQPSVGQWQKLALARAFYRNANILILDEPTASIDAEAEMKIFKKLEDLPKDKTVILISHRFSTVRQADKIAVIEGGVLSEFGTHKELLKLKKTYAKLFNLQAKGYK